MAKQFTFKRLLVLMSAAGMIGLNQNSMAAAFQLWEQDGASIGNYHAGIAVTDDASTSFYNPAGLVRIKNQQFVIGGDPVLTSFLYKGTVSVVTPLTPTAAPQAARAQGGGFNFIPFAHYAAPITDSVVFGISAVVPFGLKTDYGSETFLRYAATLSQIQVIDITPSLGIALTDKFSIGFGLDAERATANFNQFATTDATSTIFDTQSKNTASSSTSYGYHLGALFQVTPSTRFGIAYHSQVVHHLKGNSTFLGPLAADGSQISRGFYTNITLPPTTSVSIFHEINPTWDVLGSVTYTQWSVFKQSVLHNVSGATADLEPTNDIQVYVNQYYRNSWNYSVGANYHPAEQWIVRMGLGYDETPSNNKYRNVQLPDSSRIAIALGAHYQATKTIGIDGGWTHIFAMNTHIDNLSQNVGPNSVTTDGSVRSAADVFGVQLKWDIL